VTIDEEEPNILKVNKKLLELTYEYKEDTNRLKIPQNLEFFKEF
jgi:hypothetical protein